MHFFSHLLEDTLHNVKNEFDKNRKTIDFKFKPSPEAWSKREILGHLVDSAMYNLRRFNEALLSKEVYEIHAYDQDGLVRVNDYQNKNTNELFSLWLYLNSHIVFILKELKEEQLNIKINVYGMSICTLEFLIEDYIDHLKHHLKQIFE
ncbi:MAG: DinB family protein [Flavobacterium sp.]